MPNRQTADVEQQPITPKTIITWSAIIGGPLVSIVGAVLFVTNITADNRLQQQQIQANATDITKADQSSLLRHNQQQKELDEVKGDFYKFKDSQQQVNQDVAKKLDVAVALLERIEAKVNGVNSGK